MEKHTAFINYNQIKPNDSLFYKYEEIALDAQLT